MQSPIFYFTLQHSFERLIYDKFTLQGFYVALRLIANAQSGKDVSLLHISSPGPAPNLVGI